MTATKELHTGTQIIESVQDAEHSAFEAVRKFVDTVDSVFPDINTDAGPRRKIIDSAFTMVENLVTTSNRFAENVLEVTVQAMDDTHTRTPAKK
jgi:hypothetical protein